MALLGDVCLLAAKFQTPVASVETENRTRARRRSSVVRKIGSLLPLRPAKRIHFHVSVTEFISEHQCFVAVTAHFTV